MNIFEKKKYQPKYRHFEADTNIDTQKKADTDADISAHL